MDAGSAESKNGSRAKERVAARDVIQTLGSAAGLGVYLLLLGGVIYWGQLASAGLPPDTSLGTSNPRALTATGLRSLLRGPAAVLLLLIVSMALLHVEPALASERPVARVITSVGRILASVLAVLFLVYLGVVLAAIVLFGGGRLGMTIDDAVGHGAAWRVGAGALIAVVGTLILAGLRTLARPSGQQPPEEDEGTSDAPGGLRTLPPFRAARSIADLWRRMSLAARAGAVGGAFPAARRAILLALVFELAVSWYLVQDELALWAVFSGATLIGGIVAANGVTDLTGWLDRLVELWDAESPDRGRLWMAAAALAVAAFLILPLWLTTLVAGFAIAPWYVDRTSGGDERLGDATVGRLPSDWRRRAAVLIVVMSLTAIAWEATPPVSFDKAVIQIDGHEPVTLAYLGTMGSATWFAACERRDGHSTHSFAVSVPSATLGAFQLRSGGYTFYPDSTPTGASVLLGLLGISMPSLAEDPMRHVLSTSVFDTAPLRERVPPGICGDAPLPSGDVMERLRALQVAG